MIAGLSGSSATQGWPYEAAGGYVLPGKPAADDAAYRPPPAADQQSQPDPLAAQAIRKAEAAVTTAEGVSPGESARAQGAIAVARTLAAKGAVVAARLLAEQAERNLEADEPNAPGQPAQGKPSAGGGKGATGPAGSTPESEHIYQDSSNDPNASFQSPTALTPGQAAIMVPQHEREHIIHAQAEAMMSGREIVAAYTVVHYRMDPNTGEFVPSGGQAVIQTRAKPQIQPQGRNWMA